MGFRTALKSTFMAAAISMSANAQEAEFSPEQIEYMEEELVAEALKAEELGQEDPFVPVYQYIFNEITDVEEIIDPINGLTLIRTPKEGIDKSVWEWVRGAKQVNGNENGFFPQYIRNYTAEQYRLRFDPVASEEFVFEKVQRASNRVAQRFARQIINDGGFLPNLDVVGRIDAGAAASELFVSGELGISGDYAPWAGTILFPFLGHGENNFLGGANPFLEEWILQREKIENDDVGGFFKAIRGTYDLVSIAATSHNISTLVEGFFASGDIKDTIENNSIGTQRSEALLEGLRLSANSFFQKSYAVEDIGKFQIGGDLPLYGGVSLDGLDYAIHPEYIVGTLGDDFAVETTNGKDDVVNLGPGNDHIYGSNGEGDLIDGHEDVDTVDYAKLDSGISVQLEEIEGALYDKRFSVLKGSDTDDVDLLYSIENLSGTAHDDEFLLDGLRKFGIESGAQSRSDSVRVYDEEAVMATFPSYATEILAFPIGSRVSQGDIHGEGLFVYSLGVRDSLSGSIFTGIETFRNVQYAKIDALGHTYELPKSILDATQSKGVSLTLDYRDYGKSLTVDMLNGVVSDGTQEDRFAAVNASGRVLARIIGTEHGDVFDFKDNEFGSSFGVDRGSYNGPLESGEGDDLVKRASIGDLAKSNFYMRLGQYKYSGGDDAFENIYVGRVDLPLGVKASDLEFELLNKRTWYEEAGLKFYLNDVKVQVEGYGSLLLAGAASYYEGLNLDRELYYASTDYSKPEFAFNHEGKDVIASIEFKSGDDGTATSVEFGWKYKESDAFWVPGTQKDDVIDQRNSSQGLNISAQGGDDEVYGSDFRDVIYTSLGIDKIDAGLGGGRIFSGGDPDEVKFAGHDNEVYTGSGKDYCEFEAGNNNNVYLGSDDDEAKILPSRLTDKPARGSLFGEGGNDKLGTWTGYLSDGGEGVDTAVFDSNYTELRYIKSQAGLVTVIDKDARSWNSNTSIRVNGVEFFEFKDGVISYEELGGAEPLSTDELIEVTTMDIASLRLDSVIYGEMLKEPLLEMVEDSAKFEQLLAARNDSRQSNDGVDGPLFERIAAALGDLRAQFAEASNSGVKASIERRETSLVVRYENVSDQGFVVSPLIGSADALAGLEEFEADGEDVLLGSGESIEFERPLPVGDAFFFRAGIKSEALERIDSYLADAPAVQVVGENQQQLLPSR